MISYSATVLYCEAVTDNYKTFLGKDTGKEELADG